MKIPRQKLSRLFFWICADTQSNVTWTSTRHSFDSPKGHLSQNPSANIYISVDLIIYILLLLLKCPQINPCPWSKTIMFSDLSQSSSPRPPPPSDSPSHSSAVVINPPCSHLYHRMPLCVWFMSLADEWTKGHRETDTEEGRAPSTIGQKMLNGETFLILSLFCNFSETDKW